MREEDLKDYLSVIPNKLAKRVLFTLRMHESTEVALQIRGDAGPHQIPGPVRHGLASGFGGTMWTVLIMLEKELTW